MSISFLLTVRNLWIYRKPMDAARKDKNQITPIAVTNWRDIRRLFGIRERNRRGHMYIVGKTGTGKSTLIANMVASDMKQGNGLALIDPHGDLAESVLHFVPERRISDVIYWDAGDTTFPIAFNPLTDVSPDQRHLVVSGLISAFKKIWFEFWGPRLEHILRHALFTLLEVSESTLLDLPRLLTDPIFRKGIVIRLSDDIVKRFWFFEFEKYSAWLRSEAVAPILNKVGQFLTSAPLRNIVGQQRNAFRFRRVMDEGKIVVINLSKGRIGEDNAALLGAMLVTQMQLAAFSRANIPEHERRPFYLFVDEFHNFFTQSFAGILSESRKYGLNLILAHQYFAQLTPEMRAAIFGNVGTMISFRVGAEDAKYLAREFLPVFDESDFLTLPNYHLYLKLMVHGVSSPPFSATTLPLPQGNDTRKDAVIKHSRERYARPKAEVCIETTRKVLEARRQSDQQSLFAED